MEEYLKAIFEELYTKDGITCMGRGLGIDKLYAKFVQYFASFSPDYGSKSRKKLVFCLNTNGFEHTLKHIILSSGSLSLPKLINSEVNSQERADMYAGGGCFIITSRILIVDMLDQKLDPAQIDGFLVYNVHRIMESSIEAFILRVFRERNQTGFIKGFTEDAESLNSGEAKLEKLMKLLYVNRLYLWPRFQLLISQCLEKRQPIVFEICSALTPHMKIIQNALLVAMNTCLSEIKKACPTLETAQFTLENGLYKSFDHSLRYQLDQDWHRISWRTKQLVSDLTVLRKLMEYLIRYDAFSFYYLLQKLQKVSAEQAQPALWLMSEAGNQIFKYAERRVYELSAATAATAQSEVKCHPNSSNNKMETDDKALMKKLVAAQNRIKPALECPPKWKILLEVLREIRKEWDSIVATSRVTSSSSSTTSTSAYPSSATSNRVILVVRDDYVQTQTRDVILQGHDAVIDQRYRWFISQQAGETRSALIAKRRLAAAGGGGGSGASSSRPTRVGAARAWRVVGPRAGGGDNNNNDGAFDKPPLFFDNALDDGSATTANNGGAERERGVAAEEIMLNSIIHAATTAMTTSSAAGSEAGKGGGDKSTDAFFNGRTTDIPDDPFNFMGLGCSKVELLSLSEEKQMVLVEELRLKNTEPLLQCNSLLSDIDTFPSTSDKFKTAEEKKEEEEYTVPAKRAKLNDTSLSSIRNASSLTATREVPTRSDSSSTSSNVVQVNSTMTLTLTAQLLDPELHLTIVTHAMWREVAANILSDIQPLHVILYDPDISIIRALEVYQASACRPVKIHFMMLGGSTEERRYAGALAREKKSFDELIRRKEQLVISLPDNPAELQREKIEDLAYASGDSRLTQRDLNKLKGACNKQVVVDVREFRASLASMLHFARFSIVPRTLYVGDYVLSPEICIERKGISDLFQSFASGRLYNQAEAMGKYYKYPCLLIEFSPDKAFSLLTTNEISGDIQQSSIISKVTLLAMSFPNLRFLWSRSPAASAQIMRAISQGHDAPDVHKAMQAGAGSDGRTAAAIMGTTEEECGTDYTARSGDYATEAEARLSAQEMLLSLPGITVHNFRGVMDSIRDIAELSTMSEAKLAPLIGPGNGKKLRAFFKQSLLL